MSSFSSSLLNLTGRGSCLVCSKNMQEPWKILRSSSHILLGLRSLRNLSCYRTDTTISCVGLVSVLGRRYILHSCPSCCQRVPSSSEEAGEVFLPSHSIGYHTLCTSHKQHQARSCPLTAAISWHLGA